MKTFTLSKIPPIITTHFTSTKGILLEIHLHPTKYTCIFFPVQSAASTVSGLPCLQPSGQGSAVCHQGPNLMQPSFVLLTQLY